MCKKYRKKHYKLLTAEEAEMLWKQAGIENDFIFYACFQNEKIMRPFLEAVLRKKIAHIAIHPQHEIRNGILTKYIRCDVYVEGENTVYIVEMQCGNYRDLFLRARYDHSASDVYRTRRGTGYNDLGESIVIYICYDHPFAGSTRRMLTGITVFKEQPELPYEDKVKTIFLDAAGTTGKVHPAIQNFLDYVRNPTKGLNDPFVKMVDDEVKEVKKLEENRSMFITREMEKRANEVRIQRAIEAERQATEERLQKMQEKAETDKQKAINKTSSDMIRTMHRNGMSAKSISSALSKDLNEVEKILQSNN